MPLKARHSAASTRCTNDQELVATVATVPPPPLQADGGKARNGSSAAGGAGGWEQRKGTTAAHLWPSPPRQFGVLPFEGFGGVPPGPVFASGEHRPPP